ncbi:tetraspanin-18 [Cornus florida]|uniref:tetraspanin-18 n=1 Tax=Cornus florida TaxID=4283 RepID=UPI00289F54F2|nr:tetraspanin-18 [Cornus florida]
MRTPCCHTFLAFHLKFLNFLQSFVGLSIIVYSVYMLNQWNNQSLVPPASAPSPGYSDFLLSNFDLIRVPDRVTPLNFATDVVSGFDGLKLALPAPWFIYAFMGVGILLCCISCVGHIAAEAINGCCLCFHVLLTVALILLEVALVAFIALNRQWEKDLPFDPTGEVDSFRAFIEDNADVCVWVGNTVLIIQALSLFIAMILRAMVSTQKAHHDIEGDYDVVSGRTREPLLNPHLSQTSGSIKGDARGVHSDIWASRMREKYGLSGGSDANNNLLN